MLNFDMFNIFCLASSIGAMASPCYTNGRRAISRCLLGMTVKLELPLEVQCQQLISDMYYSRDSVSGGLGRNARARVVALPGAA